MRSSVTDSIMGLHYITISQVNAVYAPPKYGNDNTIPVSILILTLNIVNIQDSCVIS